MRRVLQRRPRKSGDSWQVIYMDLMTTIMVFFVILWSINSRQQFGVSTKMGEETVRMINLPGDVLFASGANKLTKEGKKIFNRLFRGKKGNSVLSFEDSGLSKRLLVIHGHTDGDGPKEDNFQLGYERAYSAYEQLQEYDEAVPDHVVICTHADNSPEKEVPEFEGAVTAAERQAVRQAKSQNRRIAIEDKMVSRYSDNP